MTRDELREAIVKPAKAVQVEFEPGLVDTILDDVEKRPGSLPLLQFALREMWARLKTPLMARADYDAIGGVEGALAKRAQAIFDKATHQNETDADCRWAVPPTVYAPRDARRGRGGGHATHC